MLTGDCLILQPIHQVGIDRLAQAGLWPRLAAAANKAALSRALADCVAVITRAGLSAEAINAASRVRVIGVHGTGTDSVAVREATRAGIVVVNTPNANARSVAEHTLALIFALTKKLVAADQATRAGDFGFKFNNRLTELQGCTLGLIGFGGIGKATARLANGLGMRVLAYGPSRADAEFAEISVERAESIQAVLTRADIVSLHLPLTETTSGLIGQRELALMKPEAFLINTSRGGLIDEPALIAALEAGVIAGAGLDVFASEDMSRDHPLLRQERAILTPHTAGSTEACLKVTALAVAGHVVDVLSGRKPAALVNPDVWENRRS
jgi:D-3-phosphoglycerate dehydrogenase